MKFYLFPDIHSVKGREPQKLNGGLANFPKVVLAKPANFRLGVLVGKDGGHIL